MHKPTVFTRTNLAEYRTLKNEKKLNLTVEKKVQADGFLFL